MKTAILLSGGVDSSVALRLLKDQGYDVTAFYLKIWLQDEFTSLGDCPWEEDIEYAKAVCDQAGVGLEVVSLQNEYWDSVVTYTIDEVQSGRTPNPDVFCNSLIKFGQFYNKIDSSYEKVASGHYAKLEFEKNKFLLKRSPDKIKDQTYFLSYLTQEQLSRALFPIGNFSKKEIRDLARKFQLPTKDRRDSQGICFLGQIKFKEFIKFHLGEKEGKIIHLEDGKILGTHSGYYFYTIGQRSGLGLSGGPWFVVKKDIEENIIYVSLTNEINEIESKYFSVVKCNWISGAIPEKNNLTVKIRHGEKMIPCNLEMLEDGSGRVELFETDKGIAPGQFAVFYDGDICLGGSIISEREFFNK